MHLFRVPTWVLALRTAVRLREKIRWSLMKTTLSVNGPPSTEKSGPSTRSKPRSRNKFGMKANDYSQKERFRHSDKAPGRNLDALASMALTKNEEQILALEDSEKN